jgi:hypothetical protein
MFHTNLVPLVGAFSSGLTVSDDASVGRESLGGDSNAFGGVEAMNPCRNANASCSFRPVKPWRRFTAVLTDSTTFSLLSRVPALTFLHPSHRRFSASRCFSASVGK